MNLIILPKSKEVLDIAFRRARKEAAMMKKQRHAVKDAKSSNIRKIEISTNYIITVFDKATAGFPDMRKVNPFYKELMETTSNIPETLKALGHISAERKIMKKLKGRAIGEIKGLKKEEIGQAKKITKDFYGRLSGLVKKLDKSIEKYNRTAKKLKELPKVKADLPTAIIAGYPNTGKSTILGRLTESQPKVASYPFTTQKLEIGYLIHNYLKFQLIDTPGLLDRPFEQRNTIEKKGVSALRHLANLVIFVIDPTLQCGFPLEQQVSLLKDIREEFRGTEVITVINKADIASAKEMEKAKKEFPKAIIEGNTVDSGLEEKIGEILKEKNNIVNSSLL